MERERHVPLRVLDTAERAAALATSPLPDRLHRGLIETIHAALGEFDPLVGSLGARQVQNLAVMGAAKSDVHYRHISLRAPSCRGEPAWTAPARPTSGLPPSPPGG